MLINAYYFRQHMYTLVPRHVRDDMAWMADCGTQVVSLAVLEQDLEAARANVEIICREADRVGMRVWAVPSRWGGLVAGAPKVASTFAAGRPETWALGEDGTAHLSVGGPMCSIHHPATLEFFCRTLEIVLRQWPISGIIWDEPKGIHVKDRSPAAVKALPQWSAQGQCEAFAAFFEAASRHGKSVNGETEFALLLQAHHAGAEVERFAAIPALDYFGCDGRPWAAAEGGQLEAAGKTLLDQGPRFIAAATVRGKKSLLLVENHNLPVADYEKVDRGLDAVMQLRPDQLVYYYYPRNLEDPEALMGIIARYLREQKGRP